MQININCYSFRFVCNTMYLSNTHTRFQSDYYNNVDCTFYHDVATVTHAVLTMGDNVQGATLAESDNGDFADDDCVITGWGSRGEIVH